SDEHAGVADEAAQAADACRALARPLEAIGVVRLADDPWGGQVLEEVLPDADRTGPRTAAAVGGAERLVDVEMHDVETGLAGLEPTEDCVEVGAVHVREGPGVVDGVEQLADPPLEEPE